MKGYARLPDVLANRPEPAVEALIEGIGEALFAQADIRPTELVKLEWGVQEFRCGAMGIGNLVSMQQKADGKEGIPPERHADLMLASAWGAGLCRAHGVVDDPRITIETDPGGILADHWYWFDCGFPFPTREALRGRDHRELMWMGFGLVFERVHRAFKIAAAGGNKAPTGTTFH